MTDYPCAPLLTELDEADSSEGGIDPLGTEPIAEELGVRLSPGVRERQNHPRFLTATAVSLWICEGYSPDTTARDGITPPWLVFEWYVVEGLVRSRGTNGEDIAGLPGRNKATAAWKDRVPLAETQDEKMYRVVMDRERWFNVVMGEQFKVDARSAEALAKRIPLPLSVARELALRLEVQETAFRERIGPEHPAPSQGQFTRTREVEQVWFFQRL